MQRLLRLQDIADNLAVKKGFLFAVVVLLAAATAAAAATVINGKKAGQGLFRDHLLKKVLLSALVVVFLAGFCPVFICRANFHLW
jgi:hypothetical protein